MAAGDGSEQRARALAYRYLNRRERTVSEVRAYLSGKDVGEAAIDAAVQELTEFGTLDDRRFAHVFAQDKRDLEQWGAERIRRGLLARGLSRELIDEVAADGVASDSESERAQDVLRRRFPEPPRDRRERERAFGVLMRKGYDADTALDAIRAYQRT